MLPELVKKSIEKMLTRYCLDKVPAWAEGQVRLAFKIHDDKVTLYEEKRACPESGHWITRPVAQFRYSHDLHQWTLHYPAPRDRWHFYLNVGPSLDFGKLLKHLDEDPVHTFWE